MSLFSLPTIGLSSYRIPIGTLVLVTVADPHWPEHTQHKVGRIHAILNMQTLFPGVPGNVRSPLSIIQSTDNPQPFLYTIHLECNGSQVPALPKDLKRLE